jgi:hypothetical protein
LGGYARNWSNGGYMRLKERKNAATVKVMRRITEAAAIPPKGVWRFFRGRTIRGWLWGFKGKAGAGRLYALPYGDIVIVWRELCPCLNPLGSTGKGPVGPERSVAALRPFNFFDFFRMVGAGCFAALFSGFVLRKNEKGIGSWG